jgi:hypothetical protein
LTRSLPINRWALSGTIGKVRLSHEHDILRMAKMMSCECGWTMITPMSEGELRKHAKMHVVDADPGMRMSDADTKKMMKTA